MRKPDIAVVVWFLLSLSIAVNLILGYKTVSASRSLLASPRIDVDLVGTWLSKNPHGVRLVFLESGEFVVTEYGRPVSPVGKWQVRSGFLDVRWPVGDEGGDDAPRSTRYKTINGDMFEVEEDLFLPNVKVFTKSHSRP